MGDDDDDNGNYKSFESDSSTWDYCGEETQIFDSQLVDSPTSSPGPISLVEEEKDVGPTNGYQKCNKLHGDDAGQLHVLQNTIPCDDAAMFEDELATQVMDPDGETQLVNIGDETQLVNFDSEIEVMDITDSVEKNATQLFNDCDTEEVAVTDDEGTENTEVVDDTDELSDDDSGRRECANSTDLEYAPLMHLCMESRKEYKSKTDSQRVEQHTSGDGFKTFTSIRAASMRASGLAALNKASQRRKSPSCSTLTSEPEIEHRRTLFGRSLSHDLDKHGKLIDGPKNGNRCGNGRLIARKLFADSELAETKEPNDVDLCGAVNSPTCPQLETDLAGLSYIGSQEPGEASQANALDFVDDFLKVNIECGDECDVNKSTGGKLKPVLSAKGTQILAKSANLINEVDERGGFYWDNNLEDEGGGEFFRKKKEAFFASGGRRLKSSSYGRGRELGESRDKKQPHIHEKVMGLVCSDTKLMLGSRKANDKSENSLGTHTKDTKFRKNLIDELDNQETTEVHFDTQMAAEAMEDLCFGFPENGHDSTKGQVKEKSSIIRSRKAPLLSNDGIGTRLSKLQNLDGSESENLNIVPSDVGKRRGKMSRKRREINIVDPSMTSLDDTPAKKRRIQNVTPVARRTRQSMKDKQLDKVKHASSDLAERIDILAGFHPKGKRTRQRSSSSARSKAGISIKPIPSVCTTPVTRGTPIKELSPICMGDEYLKQSCRGSRIRSSLLQELCSLTPTGAEIISPNKDTRKRKDVTLIRVLFSRHLDEDIVKQQKKILSRLGASESSLMSDATHFIADNFVRTRNMLEAIALGKPVVTHLWLKSCGQACCHIDEKNFLLRDAKKEKEFGFSLPASLARARQNPLLKAHRVLITPNTKPGKEILASLVKAIHGVAVERMGRNALKDDKVHDGLLILSCEEDYAVCLPFLEKGAAIYSSELLLNGIVTQRLEYERHRLFLDHLKRTRSTIWLKKDDNLLVK